ncbi:hypothetical protein Tco_0473849, partial [Tanacetum coccineum]
ISCPKLSPSEASLMSISSLDHIKQPLSPLLTEILTFVKGHGIIEPRMSCVRQF